MQCSTMPMMPPTYGGSLAHPSALSYPADSGMLDELSRQLSTIRHQNRQLQRGASGQRHSNSMRIAKPRSANHSPCSSGCQQAWRRMMMNDSQYQAFQTQPAAENMYPPPTAYNPQPTRSARPVSWHPSSQQFAQFPGSQVYEQAQLQAQPQPYMDQYPGAAYADVNFFASNQELPPTPAVYSGYTSPASAFSPLSLPYTPYDQQPQQYFTQASWTVPPELSPPAPTLESPMDRTGSTSTASNSWGTFAQGFDGYTAPPTPDYFLQAPQAEPRVQSEESIPYQPLVDDEEEEGEVLYGMGLYDAPSKPMDSQMGYQSTGSSLLGSGFAYPQPTGKGLTLEAAWEPPASDDEVSQQGDDDAEGDEQDD